MVKQFLKIAGVKSQSEFYKKYPSEEAFFRAHPEAQHLVHQKMAYGGGLYAYDNGGEPISSDYPDYATFKQAHDIWEASMSTPQVDSSAVAAYNLPAAGSNGLPDYLKAALPAAIPAPPVTTPVAQSSYPDQTSAAPQAIPVPSKGRNYSGVSIVDYLKAIGLPADFASRQEMAEDKGISNYRGTADQNLALLSTLRGQQGIAPVSHNQGSNSKGAISVSHPGVKVAPQHIPVRDEFVNPPDSSDSPVFSKPGMVQDKNGNWIWPTAALAAGAAGAGYGLAKFAGPGTAAAGQYASDLSKANLTTDQLIGYAKKFGKDPETWQLLKARGMNDFDIAAALKGISFKTTTSGVPKNVIQSTQNLLDKFGKASASEAKNLENAKRIVQVLKDKKLPRNQDVLDKLAELVPNPAKRMELLKGIPFPETAGSAIAKAQAATAALSKGNKAAKAGSAAANAASKIAQAGEEESLLSKIPLIGKYLKGFADGGPYGNVPQHGRPQGPDDGTYYQGNYFGAGGSYNPTSIDYGNALPEFAMGYNIPEAMYGMGMAYGGAYQDGGSPLYSTQGQTLRNFTNTVAFTPNQGWNPGHVMMPNVGFSSDVFAQGGPVKGGEYDMSEDQIQNLINQGYKIEYV
jgi:hypothetical protein